MLGGNDDNDDGEAKSTVSAVSAPMSFPNLGLRLSDLFNSIRLRMNTMKYAQEVRPIHPMVSLVLKVDGESSASASDVDDDMMDGELIDGLIN